MTSYPTSTRLNDASNPRRAEQFAAVAKRRGANHLAVFRALVDAYIACDGDITFPCKLEKQHE